MANINLVILREPWNELQFIGSDPVKPDLAAFRMWGKNVSRNGVYLVQLNSEIDLGKFSQHAEVSDVTKFFEFTGHVVYYFELEEINQVRPKLGEWGGFDLDAIHYWSAYYVWREFGMGNTKHEPAAVKPISAERFRGLIQTVVERLGFAGKVTVEDPVTREFGDGWVSIVFILDPKGEDEADNAQ